MYTDMYKFLKMLKIKKQTRLIKILLYVLVFYHVEQVVCGFIVHQLSGGYSSDSVHNFLGEVYLQTNNRERFFAVCDLVARLTDPVRSYVLILVNNCKYILFHL